MVFLHNMIIARIYMLSAFLNSTSTFEKKILEFDCRRRSKCFMFFFYVINHIIMISKVDGGFGPKVEYYLQNQNIFFRYDVSDELLTWGP